MKTVNSLSGGKTSSFLAVHYPADYDIFSLVCIDEPKAAPKDKSLIYYANAKLEKGGYVERFGEFIATAEDDKTLAAMQDLEQLIGREIIWVRGKSFDQVIDEGTQTRLPSWARRYCTIQMKLEPIFYYWFSHIGEERIKMRLGFRFDEFGRMESFFNNDTARGGFKVPVACSTKGKRLQRHETFDYRFCTFPLIQAGITEATIKDYWRTNGWIGGQTLYDGPRRQIEFPIVSNCVGCFHKKPETLAVMWNLHPEKMAWFAAQEGKEMGTWLDNKVTYQAIGDHALSTPYIEEMLTESGAACDSGGCHD